MNTPLSILRRLNNQKRPSAWKPHPTVEETEEFRLRYLAAIAFFIAVGRKPSIAEHEVFINFCATLNIPAQEACEQFDMRDSLNGETLLEIIEEIMLPEKSWIHWFFIFDIIWLQKIIDGQRSIDKETLFELCLLMGIPGDSWVNINEIINNFRNNPKKPISYYCKDKVNDGEIGFFIGLSST